MSVPRCGTCKRYYWRYDGSVRGFCSWACFNGRKRKGGPKSNNREDWDRMLAMKEHRRLVHGSSDLGPWYDCETCEVLEERYTQRVTGAG